MDAFKIIQHECSKYQFCADCPFIDYEDPKRGTCLFMKSPEIWDVIKMWDILREVGFISDSIELLNGLIKQLEAMEPEVNKMDPNAWELYDEIMDILNNCLKVG